MASILQFQNDGVALSMNIDLLLDKQSLETLVLLPAHLSVERTRLHTARNRYTGGQNKQLMVMSDPGKDDSQNRDRQNREYQLGKTNSDRVWHFHGILLSLPIWQDKMRAGKILSFPARDTMRVQE